MPQVTDPGLLARLNGAQQSAPVANQGSNGGIPTFQVPKSPEQVADEQRKNRDAQLNEMKFGLSVSEANKPPAGYRWTSNGNMEPIPGGPADPNNKPPTQLDAKQEDRAGKTAIALQQLDDVEKMYRGTIQGGWPNSISGRVPDALRPDNETFNNAALQMLPLIRPIVAATAKEGDSEKEMEVFLSYVPKATDNDQTIEYKLKSLRRLLTGMQQGMAPSQVISGDKGNQQQPNAAVAPPPAFNGGSGPDVNRSPAMGTTPVNPSDPQAGFSTGDVKYENDPQLAGVQKEYLRRLEAGQSADEIISWLNSAGVSAPNQMDAVRAQVEYRKQHPDVPIGRYDASGIDDRAIPQSPSRQILNSIADSPFGAYVMNAGNAVLGNYMDNLTANPELTRLGMDQVNARNPGSAIAGQLSGGAMAALLGEAGLARAGLGRGVAALGSDIGYGAYARSGEADNNRGVGALTGAAAGLVGNRVGAGVTNLLGRMVGGVSDPAVNALMRDSVPLTVGQATSQSGTIGRGIKALEDRAAGFSGVGDVINARRLEGVTQWNSAMFDRALKPVGASVGGRTGEDAVQLAQQAVSDAYTKALAGKAVAADAPFANQLGKAVAGAMKLPRVGNEVADSIKTVLEPYLQGNQLTGEAMQQISRELRAMKSGYRTDPLASRIGTAIDEVEDSVFGMFRRQAPEVLPAYRKATAAQRRLYILEDAVLKAKNTDGLFTPAQLGTADRAGTVRYGGKRAAASGGSPFFRAQRDAQNVLPSKIPDSGTAGRMALLVPAAVASSGAGVGYAAGDAQTGAAGGLTLAAALSLAYTRAGQRALVAAAAKRGAKAVAAGKAIKGAASKVGVISGGALPAILPTPGSE